MDGWMYVMAFLTIRGNGTNFLSELRAAAASSFRKRRNNLRPTHHPTGPSDSVSSVARSADRTACLPARCQPGSQAALPPPSHLQRRPRPLCQFALLDAACCLRRREEGRLQHAASDHFPVWLLWFELFRERDNLRGGVIYCSKLFRGRKLSSKLLAG